MNTAKVYQDSEGKDCSIWKMLVREPEWAANRIQEGEKAIKLLADERAENAAIQAENATMKAMCLNDPLVQITIKEARQQAAREAATLSRRWRGTDGISCSHRLDIADAIEKHFGIEEQ